MDRIEKLLLLFLFVTVVVVTVNSGAAAMGGGCCASGSPTRSGETDLADSVGDALAWKLRGGAL